MESTYLETTTIQGSSHDFVELDLTELEICDILEEYLEEKEEQEQDLSYFIVDVERITPTRKEISTNVQEPEISDSGYDADFISQRAACRSAV